jgi:hypothetical protein
MLMRFSGKMPDWMVQMPAASVELINALEQHKSDAPSAHLRGDIDRIFHDADVCASVRYCRRGYPTQNAPAVHCNVSVIR